MRIAAATMVVAGVAITLPELYDGRDAGLFRAAAAALTPRPSTRPSEWATTHVVLTAAMGVTEPGAFNPGYLPWQRSLIDTQFEFPQYRGWVATKFAQAGYTWAVLPCLAQHIAERDGNALYLIGREEDSKRIAGQRFSAVVKARPVAERLEARDESDRRSDTTTDYPFDAGTVSFSTAGSVAAVSTTTFVDTTIDEFDQCENAFKKGNKYGGLYGFVLARMNRVFGGGYIRIMGHPTDGEVGIAVVTSTQSTEHRWVFDCPHCQGPCDLTSACIKFTEFGDDGRPDARKFVLACPCCGHAISEHERRTAVWERGTREGATGHWWTPLADADCTPERRPLLGRMVNGLMDPGKSVGELARLLASAWNDQVAMKSVLNTHFGEWTKKAVVAVSAEAVETAFAMSNNDRPALPGGPMGVQFITVGADVQAPKENPTLYAVALAYMGNGEVWVVEMRKLAGWAAYNGWIGGLRFPVADGRVLAPDVEGIDRRFLTGDVMDNCRLLLTTTAATVLQRIPVQHEASPSLNRQVTFKMLAEAKRIHPHKPWLGAIDAYELHRHSWVEMILGIYRGMRLRFACNLSGLDSAPTRREVESHFHSQNEVYLKDTHGFEKPEPEWAKIKDRRDDWLMACNYANVAAWLGRTSAGTLSERVYAVTSGQARPELVVPRIGTHGDDLDW